MPLKSTLKSDTVTTGKYIVLLIDGLKVAKEGRKMPGVKCLQQKSNNNSKAEYIMGHSIQCLALLAKSLTGCMVAVPLIAEIHEGIVLSNRDQRTLNDKAVSLVRMIQSISKKPLMIVADAYYCNATFIRGLLNCGCQLLTRVRNNAVAYYPAEQPIRKMRGRPKKYGQKIVLKTLFQQPELFTACPSRIYGEAGQIELRYYVIYLLWGPSKRMMRFVLVDHPNRGKAIFTTTDLTFDPIDALETYGYRQKIEVSFKHALHIIGTYGYHFWMKGMDSIKKLSGDQYLHRKSKVYREAVLRKMQVYATYILLGCIAQGLLLHLCLNHSATVWNKFGSWLRTMHVNAAPSELVAANALRTTLPEFLLGSSNQHAFKIFLLKNMDPELDSVLRLAG